MSSNRASSHQCKDPKCRSSATSIKLADGTRHKSKYCRKHACKIGWGGCNRRARSGKDFCKKHLTCGKHDCDVQVKGDHLKSRRVPWLCSKHIAPPILPIIPKCQADDCSKRQLDESRFCVDHKCEVDDCSAEKWEESAHCDDHQPCAARNCRQYAPYNDVEHRPEPYCWGHRRCMTLGCSNVVDRRHNHCQAHECCIGGCKAEKYIWEEREQRNDHCRLHTCSVPNCNIAIVNVRVPPPETAFVLARHCPEHKCGRQRCFKPSKFRCSPCRDHACRVDNCPREKEQGHDLCLDHECEAPGCNETSMYNLGVSYCNERHACAWKGDGAPCKERRTHRDPNPDLCHEHSHLRFGQEERKKTPPEQDTPRRDADTPRGRGSREDRRQRDDTRSRDDTPRRQRDYSPRGRGRRPAQDGRQRGSPHYYGGWTGPDDPFQAQWYR